MSFMDRLNELNAMRDEAKANLASLADQVRANPNDADLKAKYREASEVVASYREFERGGPSTETGSRFGNIRGIAGDIEITRDDPTKGA